MGADIKGPYALQEVLLVGKVTTAPTDTFNFFECYNDNPNLICVLAAGSAGDGKLMLYNNAGTQIFNLNAGALSSWFNTGIHIGSNTGTTSDCLLKMTSTSAGFRPPVMTNAQVAAIGTPTEGLLAYDTNNHHLMVYNGSAWRNITDTA